MHPTETRLAAYAVCRDGDRVLLVLCPPVYGPSLWTLPGGRVEHGEDPVDAVIREVAEETGRVGVVERLLGVDSRVIRSAERHNHGPDLHNIGIYYEVRLIGGESRPEPGGATAGSDWIRTADVAGSPRSSLVDIGLALAEQRPPTGHVPPIEVTGLLHH